MKEVFQDVINDNGVTFTDDGYHEMDIIVNSEGQQLQAKMSISDVKRLIEFLQDWIRGKERRS